MIINEKQQQVAIDIIQKHRTKKSCKLCYNRGYLGFTPDKTLVPCDKCVDLEKAYAEWKEYVAGDPVLRAGFPELFEDDEKVETEETAEAETKEHHTPVKQTPAKKDGNVRKEANLKTQKSTTVRKSGNR